MSIVRHFKKIHNAIGDLSFMVPQKSIGYLSFSVTFTDDSKYDIGIDNQADWNKLIGIKSSLFSQQKDGVMAVWRYVKLSDKFQVALYAHGGKDYASSITESGYAVGAGNAYVSLGVFVVPKNTETKFHLVLHENVCSLYKESKEGTNSLRLSRGAKFISGWRINPWFGGNKTANCSYALGIIK